MDMVFSLRQIQEKCTEQNMPMYAVFIDFTKAFDTVSREGLWCVLKKYGVTDKVINLIKHCTMVCKPKWRRGEPHHMVSL